MCLSGEGFFPFFAHNNIHVSRFGHNVLYVPISFAQTRASCCGSKVSPFQTVDLSFRE